MDITIRPGVPADAPYIGKAIVMAVGEEIIQDLGRPDHTVDDVERMFRELSRLDDSQYSWRNTIVAEGPDREVCGVCICYDGAELHRLRERFYEGMRTYLAQEIGPLADETSPDEVYIDTLAVFEPYRRQGIAHKLLCAAKQRAKEIGKHAGLLVDKDNARARRVYESAGFRYTDDRPFAGVMMDHMVSE